MQVSAQGSATIHFTNDLPNGPYGTQDMVLKYQVYIKESATVADIKLAIEKCLKTMSGGMAKMTWTVVAINYKGGDLPFTSPANTIKEGETVNYTYRQSVTPCIIL
eukprot:TRINITY_DN15083_c0_g1_i1.p2 TRINITY_DN15083_c0_g1~~TRINITY_DN15083_c0_g1_i1.p2  ORF type:complete len:106 (+),score=24.11 TRINITY_DN15083_c0_g1_i1:85-402(+)